jgi:hypothetical protein
MAILNKPAPSDVIPASTLNLTKISSIAAGALGTFTLGSTAIAPNDEVLGFDQGQRFVLVIVLIAAVAVIQAVDMLARAIASSRSSSAGMVLLRNPPKATLVDGVDPDNGRVGRALAVRPDGRVLFHDGDAVAKWVPGDRVLLG